MFWCLPFGFPGPLVYKVVNAMDSMIGRRTPRHRAYGMTAARPEGALNPIPARPRLNAGQAAADPWIGDGTARATHRDIRRTLYLYVCACLINGAWVAAIAVIRFSPSG